MVRVWWHGAGLGGWALQGRRDSTQSRALVGQLSARTPAQAAPASPGLQGWPLPVASHATGAGWRIAVEPQGCTHRIAQRFGIASEDGAGAGVPRWNLDTDMVRLSMECSGHLHDLRGQSASHRDGEVAQGGGRTVPPPDAL